MNDLAAWWDGLSLALKIYWAIAIPFTLFFVLQLALSFMGGDVPDDTPDAEIDADTGIAFQFFTLKNLIAFFSIFGWVGIACLDSGLSQTAALVIATLSGVAMMTLMASLLYFLSKANANGTLRLSNARGNVGEVYLTIPAKRHSMGKVQVKVQGALRTLDAMTDDEADIPTGKMIKVTDVVNDSILLVTVHSSNNL
jgi:hypothetical protein